MIYLVQTQKQVEDAFNQLKSEPLLGADTETTGLDPLKHKILLIQIGTPKFQYVFDMARIPSDSYEPIFKILKAEKIVKIFQNGKFDYKMLKSNYGIRVKNLADTMITEQLLTKGVKKKGFGLGELVSKYRAGKMSKDVREGFSIKKYGDTFTQQQIEYAANDVAVLEPIYNAQRKIALSKGMLDLVNLENEAVRVTAEMELNGIFLNEELWSVLEDEARESLKIYEKNLQKHFEPFHEKNLFGLLDINYGSPKQVKPALEQVIGFELKSTDAKYLKQFNEPVIKDLTSYREELKKITTYGRVFLKNIHELSHRIHAKYLQLGTDSGRESCTDPNMQNIPKDQRYRTPFQAQSKDDRIISADFASQELRVLAQLSGEEAFINAIEEGLDLHKMVASILFRKPYDEISDEERAKGKTLNFGTIYGFTAYGLAKALEISKKDAQALLNKFFIAFPKINKFLREMESKTERLRCAISPLDGRIRDLGSIDWDDWRKRGHALNIGKNHPIQGASASITKLALIKIQNYIEDKNKEASIIAVIHDEILVECHKDIAEEMKKIMEEKMISAFNYYCPDIPMEVGAIISNHWVH